MIGLGAALQHGQLHHGKTPQAMLSLKRDRHGYLISFLDQMLKVKKIFCKPSSSGQYIYVASPG
jgi:hypothetical protein